MAYGVMDTPALTWMGLPDTSMEARLCFARAVDHIEVPYGTQSAGDKGLFERMTERRGGTGSLARHDKSPVRGCESGKPGPGISSAGLWISASNT